jgi:amino acid transporter
VAKQGRTSGLGTFAGVFTPSVLTILGLILFRRLGYVVGGAGLAQALAIILMANAISVLTSTSLSAIATNLRVKGGGDYYLISRSLGVEFGGAIGIVLFFAQSISVAFYLIGFAEAVVVLLPTGVPLSAPVLATAATCFLFIFAWLGADWATRLQYVVMAALAGGLLSFVVGAAGRASAATLAANWSVPADTGLGFWVLFALFFPAVTGFTQGVSMSGDLADPGRSLPRGTFAAVGASLLVYVGFAVLFAAALPAGELTADYDAMNRIAWRPELIVVGVIAATISSALASFLGAPRILQALAVDDVFPLLRPFAHGSGPSKNPRRGVLATLAIALVFVALGGVDFIAPIVSMFFLISYGLLNYATAFEARAASPSFRPRFRWFHYRASLAGALGCLGMMVMISPWASALAIALVFALYQYVERLAPPGRWADSRRDHYFQNVRKNLLALSQEPVHPRNWHPHLLVFSDESERRDLLVRFASWLEGGAGVTTVVRLVHAEGDTLPPEAESAAEKLREDLAARELEAYPLVVAARDSMIAVQTLLQAYGIGPIRANTILLNWLERDFRASDIADGAERAYVKQLRAAQRFGVNVVVLDAKEEPFAGIAPLRSAERRIDVWWWNDASSRLMLLFAYLMTRSEDWVDARIRLLVGSHRRAKTREESKLEETLTEFRIDADVEAIDGLDRDKLIATSSDASVVLLPLRFRRQRAVDPFGEPVDELLAELPVVALVAAGEDIELDAEPDEDVETDGDTTTTDS